jgi:hypothetical protein
MGIIHVTEKKGKEYHFHFLLSSWIVIILDMLFEEALFHNDVNFPLSRLRDTILFLIPLFFKSGIINATVVKYNNHVEFIPTTKTVTHVFDPRRFDKSASKNEMKMMYKLVSSIWFSISTLYGWYSFCIQIEPCKYMVNYGISLKIVFFL